MLNNTMLCKLVSDIQKTRFIFFVYFTALSKTIKIEQHYKKKVL